MTAQQGRPHHDPSTPPAGWHPSPRRPPGQHRHEGSEREDIGLLNAWRERAPIDEPTLGTGFDAGVPSTSRNDEGVFVGARPTDVQLPQPEARVPLAPGTLPFHGKSLPAKRSIGRPPSRARSGVEVRGTSSLGNTSVLSQYLFGIQSFDSEFWANTNSARLQDRLASGLRYRATVRATPLRTYTMPRVPRAGTRLTVASLHLQRGRARTSRRQGEREIPSRGWRP
jgi:hypothetical protein